MSGNGLRSGFTLIELLVVVLIIGILSAVALPRYEKAVWKSRATELLTLTRSLATAQEIYYMANGEYPKNFSELDLGFQLPSSGGGSPCGLVIKDRVFSPRYELTLNSNDGKHYLSSSMFLEGPYKCGGFTWTNQSLQNNVSDKKLYCWEYTGAKFAAGDFCQRVMGYRFLTNSWNYFRVYEP